MNESIRKAAEEVLSNLKETIGMNELSDRRIDESVTILKEALSQPEQSISAMLKARGFKPCPYNSFPLGRPVYTSPPEIKRLSDEEVSNEMYKHMDKHMRMNLRQMGEFANGLQDAIIKKQRTI